MLKGSDEECNGNCDSNPWVPMPNIAPAQFKFPDDSDEVVQEEVVLVGPEDIRITQESDEEVFRPAPIEIYPPGGESRDNQFSGTELLIEEDSNSVSDVQPVAITQSEFEAMIEGLEDNVDVKFVGHAPAQVSVDELQSILSETNLGPSEQTTYVAPSVNQEVQNDLTHLSQELRDDSLDLSDEITNGLVASNVQVNQPSISQDSGVNVFQASAQSLDSSLQNSLIELSNIGLRLSSQSQGSFQNSNGNQQQYLAPSQTYFHPNQQRQSAPRFISQPQLLSVSQPQFVGVSQAQLNQEFIQSVSSSEETGHTQGVSVSQLHPQNIQVNQAQTFGLTQSQSFDGVPQVQTIDVSQPQVIGVSQPQTIEVSQPQTLEEPQLEAVSGSQLQNVEVSEPQIIEISQPQVVEVSQPEQTGSSLLGSIDLRIQTETKSPDSPTKERSSASQSEVSAKKDSLKVSLSEDKTAKNKDVLTVKLSPSNKNFGKSLRNKRRGSVRYSSPGQTVFMNFGSPRSERRPARNAARQHSRKSSRKTTKASESKA